MSSLIIVNVDSINSPKTAPPVGSDNVSCTVSSNSKKSSSTMGILTTLVISLFLKVTIIGVELKSFGAIAELPTRLTVTPTMPSLPPVL